MRIEETKYPAWALNVVALRPLKTKQLSPVAFSSNVSIAKPNVGITGIHAPRRGEPAATRYDARISLAA